MPTMQRHQQRGLLHEFGIFGDIAHSDPSFFYARNHLIDGI